MWFKIYADGTEIDIVHADNVNQAVEIVKLKNPDTSFEGVKWRFRIL